MGSRVKKQRVRAVYEVTFENKRDAMARIEYLIDAHSEDNPYVSCKGCEKCDEIEDIRRSFIDDIVGKKSQKKMKTYKKRVITEGTEKIVKEMLEKGYSGRAIARGLALSLNTVEFFRREWVREKNKDIMANRGVQGT